MPKIKITISRIADDVLGGKVQFPPYTTQVLNLANQNSQGTRPKVVGQMSELIKEANSRDYAEWVAWYKRKMPDAIDKATDRVYAMALKIKDATAKIDRPMARAWVEDLVLSKTFIGFRFQESVLKKLPKSKCSHIGWQYLQKRQKA